MGILTLLQTAYLGYWRATKAGEFIGEMMQENSNKLIYNKYEKNYIFEYPPKDSLKQLNYE
jgi:hypothetical protein